MIPKIIHYCWLGNRPLPEEMQRYIAVWKEKLPDYEFRLWNSDRFDINESIWVKEAFEAGKYAFAADYIRLYALYRFGGIYMDTDVEVVKPFDTLLDSDHMLGYEYPDGIESGIMGAVKGSAMIKACLDYYENRHFVRADGSYDLKTLPAILYSVLGGYVDSNRLVLLPQEVLTAKSHVTGRIYKTAETRTIHHFACSWREKTPWERCKIGMRNHLPDSWLMRYHEWKKKMRRLLP